MLVTDQALMVGYITGMEVLGHLQVDTQVHHLDQGEYHLYQMDLNITHLEQVVIRNLYGLVENLNV
jgi:hypothetical protein